MGVGLPNPVPKSKFHTFNYFEKNMGFWVENIFRGVHGVNFYAKCVVNAQFCGLN